MEGGGGVLGLRAFLSSVIFLFLPEIMGKGEGPSLDQLNNL